jgi:hypothetical protein
MIVFTVTVIDIIGDPVLGNRRTPAIFTSLTDAIRAVRDNEGDMADDGFYQYAVIEETLLNVVYPFIDGGEKLWFKYNSILDEFEPCKPPNIPSKIAKLYGFGIG